MGKKCLKKCLITGETITKAKSRCGEELGYTADDHEVVEFRYKRNCREGSAFRCEFDISLIDHNEDTK